MKILYCITGLGVGGAERIVVDLADVMSSRGHSVKIICLYGDVKTLPMSSDVEIFNLGLKKFNIIKVFNKYIKIVNSFNPDIIHAHMYHAIILSRISKIFSHKAKMISHAHNTSFGGTSRAFLYRKTDYLSDLNINVSDVSTNHFLEKKIFNAHNTITLVNGINTDKFFSDKSIRKNKRLEFSLDNSILVFISIGSFTLQKDHYNLLHAYKKFKSTSNIDSKLFIVGDGLLRNQILSLINELNLNDSVILLGLRKDINDLLNMSDVFILSSAWEGLPLVIAEAMAAEKVIISTDCGGVKQLIGLDNFLVPIKDAAALADKMLAVSNLNKSAKEAIGIKNRKRVIDEFSLHNMIEKLLMIYHKLIS